MSSLIWLTPQKDLKLQLFCKIIYPDTVHNGHSDNGGDTRLLAKLSLYPIIY